MFAAVLSICGLGFIAAHASNTASADSDICCSYAQTGSDSATITVTGTSSFTATSQDTSLATVAQSGGTVDVTGVSGQIGIAKIDIAYDSSTYTVEVPIGYTVFSFSNDSLTIMPGTDTYYEVYGIKQDQQATVAVSPTSTDPYTVYQNTTDTKLNVNITGSGLYVLTGYSSNMSVSTNNANETALYMASCNLEHKFTSPLTINGTAQTTVTALQGHSNSLTDSDLNNASKYGPTSQGGSGTNQYWAQSATVKGNNSDNLNLEGSGLLTLNCNSKNTIDLGSNSEITAVNVCLEIESVGSGIVANTASFNSGNFIINSVSDGISAGTATINDGNFNITTSINGDGISATSAVNIAYGNFKITTGGGHAETIGDDDSAKGIYSDGTITIDDGNFVFDCADYATYSLDDFIVKSGSWLVETALDGMHSGDSDVHKTAKLTLGTTDGNGPNYYQKNGDEGLEGPVITFNGGTYYINADDDGVNASNDIEVEYGQGGSGCLLTVNGGNIYVNVEGDGLDANGSIIINGGNCVVFGQQATGDNAPYDCDDEFVINGGNVFGAGSAQMAETPAEGSQGYVYYGSSQPGPGPGPGPGPQPPEPQAADDNNDETNDDTIAAGKTLDVKDASGATKFAIVTPKNVDYVIYSDANTTDDWSIEGDNATAT